MYLSNRMPRTISTKPDYSIRWWRERGLKPPRRETLRICCKYGSAAWSAVGCNNFTFTRLLSPFSAIRMVAPYH